jgi:hypothetical protein
MAGVVLLVQNATDRFDTWAYAWTLVFVVGAGIGRWLVGVVRGRGDLVAGGAWLVGAGLVGFVGLAVLFEIVVGLGGERNPAASRYVLAILLIVAGLVLLGRSCWRPDGYDPVEIGKAAARLACGPWRSPRACSSGT